MHSLLRRQLKRCFGPDAPIAPAWGDFVGMVNEAYREFDNDRAMLERSLELSSQELLQAGADMRAVFKAIPDLLIRIDATARVLECKVGIVGDSAAPMPAGADLRTSIVPAHVNAFRAAAHDAWAANKIRTVEYVLGHAREARHYEARLVPVLDSQLAAFVRDITARKRAETLRIGQNGLLEMIASGESLQQILEAAVAWMEQLVPGMRGAVFLAEADARRLRLAVGPHLPAAFAAALAALPDDGNVPLGGRSAGSKQITAVSDTLQDEGWAPLHDWCMEHGIRACVAAPVLSPHHETLGTVVMYFDEPLVPGSDDLELLPLVTHVAGIAIERQRHEEELKRTVALVTSTLESTADGILVVNNDGRVVRFNQRFATLWRVPAELLAKGDDAAVLKHSVSQLKDPEAFMARVRELYAQKPAESFEVIEFKDGRVFERYSCLHRVDGEAIGRVWNFRDVTQRVRLEEQFRHAQKMDAVGRLAGGVAHDFNNLLTVILGNLSMIRAAPVPPQQQQTAIIDCLEAAKRAANLTGQLLTFSRRQPIATQELELNQVVTKMASMLRRLIGETITLNTRAGTSPNWVRADPGMMEQMLMNLAVNGRDAMPNGGELVIALTPMELDESAVQARANARPGSFVRLTVTDNGTGIARELLPRIFEPFFTTKEVGRGTGLGLATVFGIVQQHEGWIEVETQPREGTTMAVFLPRLTSGPSPAARPKAAITPRGGSESVLVVEDEKAVRSLMQRVLTTHGYTVLAAGDAREALAVWERHQGRFDLLVTDMVMPGGMSGRELAQRLGAEAKGIPVIYCSGYADDVLGSGESLRGQPNFLAKPFDVSVFLTRVRAMLDGRGNGHTPPRAGP